MADRYFILGPILGTPFTRYAILAGDHTVLGTQASRPDGVEVERPPVLRWRHKSADVEVRTKIDYQQFVINGHNGQQPRTSWRRSGRAGAQ